MEREKRRGEGREERRRERREERRRKEGELSDKVGWLTIVCYKIQ